MLEPIAYAVAISIVGVSGATTYSILTQSDRIQHIQANLLKSNISFQLQAPKKQDLLSSHHDLRNLLYMASHNLYSALQSIDSISATMLADQSLSQMQLQIILHDVLLKECRHDKRYPHKPSDPLQIHITHCGQVQALVTGTLEDTTGTRQSVIVSSAPPQSQTQTQSVILHSDDNSNGNGNGDVVIYMQRRLYEFYLRTAETRSVELAEKLHIKPSPRDDGIEIICIDRRLHDALNKIMAEKAMEEMQQIELSDQP